MPDPIIEDITTVQGTELYLVRPEQPTGPGIIWLHWFDEAPSANRSQFLDEAKEMARRGVVSVLPQLTFPWHAPPTDREADVARIAGERRRLLDAHDTLVTGGAVDAARIAMVGHDFGAMHGMTLFGALDLAASVLVAPTTRWSDWFLRFWPIDSDRYDYMRALEPLDPITTVTRATCPLLFQFGKQDFYVAAMTGLELFHAAPEAKQLLSYDTGHEMEGDTIRHDRDRFLGEHLEVAV